MHSARLTAVGGGRRAGAVIWAQQRQPPCSTPRRSQGGATGAARNQPATSRDLFELPVYGFNVTRSQGFNVTRTYGYRVYMLPLWVGEKLQKPLCLDITETYGSK